MSRILRIIKLEKKTDLLEKSLASHTLRRFEKILISYWVASPQIWTKQIHTRLIKRTNTSGIASLRLFTAVNFKKKKRKSF